MTASGSWRRVYSHGRKKISVQETLMRRAKARAPEKKLPLEQRLKPLMHKP